MTLQEIKTALRSGKYAWPGGYPLYFVTSDGGVLSFEAARAEWRQIVWAHLNNATRCGWHLAGVDVNYEDPYLECEHTGARIESAYAEEE